MCGYKFQAQNERIVASLHGLKVECTRVLSQIIKWLCLARLCYYSNSINPNKMLPSNNARPLFHPNQLHQPQVMLLTTDKLALTLSILEAKMIPKTYHKFFQSVFSNCGTYMTLWGKIQHVWRQVGWCYMRSFCPKKRLKILLAQCKWCPVWQEKCLKWTNF